MIVEAVLALYGRLPIKPMMAAQSVAELQAAMKALLTAVQERFRVVELQPDTCFRLLQSIH